jgi:uncharacterized membrane protein
LFGLLLSFAVIGQFWTTHHRLFGYVENYTGGLLWLNLHLLFWIILMPFASAMNSRYGDVNAVWMFYSLNMFMIGISIYFIWRYISQSKKETCRRIANDPVARKMALVRSFVIALIFLSLGRSFACSGPPISHLYCTLRYLPDLPGHHDH